MSSQTLCGLAHTKAEISETMRQNVEILKIRKLLIEVFKLINTKNSFNKVQHEDVSFAPYCLVSFVDWEVVVFSKWLTKPCTTKILWNNILKHSAAKFAPFFSPKNEAYSFSDWLSWWCRDNYKPLKTSLSESSYFYWQPAMPLYTHTQRHTEVVWPGIDAVEVCFFCVRLSQTTGAANAAISIQGSIIARKSRLYVVCKQPFYPESTQGKSAWHFSVYVMHEWLMLMCICVIC